MCCKLSMRGMMCSEPGYTRGWISSGKSWVPSMSCLVNGFGASTRSGERPLLSIYQFIYVSISPSPASLPPSPLLLSFFSFTLSAQRYNQLPDFFVAFDILEKMTSRFLSYPRVKQMIGTRVIKRSLWGQIADVRRGSAAGCAGTLGGPLPVRPRVLPPESH